MKPLDLDAVEHAKADAAFTEDAWLTFHLMGDPWRHDTMRASLVALGARSLEGSEGGFVYAKLPVTLTISDIQQTIDEVRHLAAEAGLEIHIIDLDSSDEIERTKFYSLWNAG